MQMLRTLIVKIWRISCANALAITGCLSVILFVEAYMLTAAIWLTIVSLLIFYYAAIRDFGEINDLPPLQPSPWSTKFNRFWSITVTNILWIFGGLTYIFFCSGIQRLYIICLTIIGFIMMYIDAYRNLLIEEAGES